MSTLTKQPLPDAPAETVPKNDDRPRLFLAGVGSVGTALLRQIKALPDAQTAPRVIGACTERRAAWYDAPRPPAEVDEAFPGGVPTDWPRLLEHLEKAAAHADAPLVFVDATDSVEVARYHARLLEAGCSVVTPSKHALTQEQAYFDRLQRAAGNHDGQDSSSGTATYHYETTAGAGLPVLSTLRDLLRTGDRIERVRGAASGTLSFLFSRLREGDPFSAAVEDAIARGYAEPDVRTDLSGEDVARKFLILGRTMGLTLERDDLDVESLVPEALRDVSLDTFLDELPRFDDEWAERTRAARENDATLQYVGRLSDGRIRVAVEEVPSSAPFGLLSSTDNLFEFQTARYHEDAPLSVRGPGAGPEVTAAGVLADALAAFRGA